jgi:uncharacterized DUF497 family protein
MGDCWSRVESIRSDQVVLHGFWTSRLESGEKRKLAIGYRYDGTTFERVATRRSFEVSLTSVRARALTRITAHRTTGSS